MPARAQRTPLTNVGVLGLVTATAHVESNQGPLRVAILPFIHRIRPAREGSARRVFQRGCTKLVPNSAGNRPGVIRPNNLPPVSALSRVGATLDVIAYLVVRPGARILEFVMRTGILQRRKKCVEGLSSGSLALPVGHSLKPSTYEHHGLLRTAPAARMKCIPVSGWQVGRFPGPRERGQLGRCSRVPREIRGVRPAL